MSPRKDMLVSGLVISAAYLALYAGCLVSNMMNQADARKHLGVHRQMAQIVSEEVPTDAQRVELYEDGTHQGCALSNGKHEAWGTVMQSPHNALISADLHREGVSWKSDSFEGAWWLESPDGSRDTDAISAPDFRELLRSCVAAVRQERRRPQTQKLTVEQNKASWGVMQSDN